MASNGKNHPQCIILLAINDCRLTIISYLCTRFSEAAV